MASKTFENFITLTQYFDSEDDILENIELQTNQEEILGFFSKTESNDWGWYSSPNQIKISLLLDGEIQEIDKNNIIIQFITEDSPAINLNDLTEFLKDESGEEIKDQLYLNLSNLKNIQELDGLKNVLQAIFKISYKYNGQNIIKILPYRLGTSNDMAKLNINAGDITASIQSTKLKFGPDGLEIFDGGLRIYDEPYQEGKIQNPVFKTTETGGLYLKGEIEATSGSFTGTIHALDLNAERGTIGGFSIKDGSLESTEENQVGLTSLDEYALKDSEGVKSTPALILNGKEGKIIANSIVLGMDAQIEEYIKLGNAHLYNPSKYENKLLESEKICLNDNGTMTIGKIEIKGSEEESYLKCGNSWWIDGNGTASFNDIYANNVHLQDAVLEATTIQSVGSLMLFKDSWFASADESNQKVIILNGTAPLNLYEGDYIYDGSTYYKVEEVNDLKVTLDKEWTSSKTIATKFGTPGKDFIFTLQGESIQRENQRDFATGNSLTISEFQEQNGNLVYKKVLVLGDLGQLNTLGNNDHSGTGLYAENVELYGSLTTQIQSGITTYAGINTKSTIGSDHFKEKVLIDGKEEDKKESIIFFAGAPTKEEINKAAFYVTDEGSLYAAKGRFEGAVITNGRIEGSEIKTAKLIGSNEGAGAALSIYDTAKGIAFKTIKEEETLLINNNQFSFCGKNFISLNEEDGIIFNGNGIKVNSLSSTNGRIMSILENKISNSNSDKICFNGESIIFNSEEANSENCSFEVNNSRITSKVSVNFYQDVNVGNNKNNLTYKPVEFGCDLYIQ